MSARDIVIVNDTASINGGAAKVALTSAIALAQSGLRVTLLAATGPVMPELEQAGVRVVLLDQPDILSDPNRLRAATSGIWNRRAAREMRRILAELHPSTAIVHAHGWTKALSAAVLAEAIDRGFPTLVTLHEYFLACPLGSFFNHQRGEICTLRPMSAACVREHCDSRSYAQKLWRVGRQAVQSTLGHLPSGVTGFVSISPFSRSILEPYLPTGARFFDVPNPNDIAQRAPSDPGASQQFVFVGRFSREKAPDLFARAAKQAGVQATFVGDGELRDAIVAANPEATLLGWRDPAGVESALRDARALVFPSVWYENAPLIVPEALALGVPAIVADTSAARDAVIDGFTGLHFRGGDVDALASALRLLAKEPELARTFGRHAYDRYWEEPAMMERHVTSLMRVYDEVLTRAA